MTRLSIRDHKTRLFRFLFLFALLFLFFLALFGGVQRGFLHLFVGIFDISVNLDKVDGVAFRKFFIREKFRRNYRIQNRRLCVRQNHLAERYLVVFKDEFRRFRLDIVFADHIEHRFGKLKVDIGCARVVQKFTGEIHIVKFFHGDSLSARRRKHRFEFVVVQVVVNHNFAPNLPFIRYPCLSSRTSRT